MFFVIDSSARVMQRLWLGEYYFDVARGELTRMLVAQAAAASGEAPSDGLPIPAGRLESKRWRYFATEADTFGFDDLDDDDIEVAGKCYCTDLV